MSDLAAAFSQRFWFIKTGRLLIGLTIALVSSAMRSDYASPYLTALRFSNPPEQHEWQLMRVSVNAQNQEWIVEYRPVNVRNEAIDAITLQAPRWNQRTNGCKHGDWGAYRQALQSAVDAGV